MNGFNDGLDKKSFYMYEVTVGSDSARGLVTTTLWTYKLSSGAGKLIIYILKMQHSSVVMQVCRATVEVFVRRFESPWLPPMRSALFSFSAHISSMYVAFLPARRSDNGSVRKI